LIVQLLDNYSVTLSDTETDSSWIEVMDDSSWIEVMDDSSWIEVMDD